MRFSKFSQTAPLILTLVFYLACLFLASGMELDERVTALLPDSDPQVRDFNTFITQVPAAEALYIQIDTQTEDPKLLAKAGDAVYAAIKETPYFSDILYRFSRDSLTGLLDLVSRNKYWLLDDEDLALAESRMTKQGLATLIPDIKRRLISPSGSFSAKGLARDPLGLDALILKRLAAFQAEMPGARAGESRIISRDGKSLLMVASPLFPAVETNKSQQMLSLLNRERERITSAFDHKIRIGFSGVHPATLDNAATIQSDVKRAVLVMTLGIFLMGILFFSRFYHVILIFVPTLVSLTFAAALAALITPKVSAIALGCGALLVGITVDFGIHILFHADTLGTGQAHAIVKKLKQPVIIGAATTMGAFGCLIFSSLPGQRQMGWLSIAGIFMAAAFALTILKYFITIKPWHPSPPLVSLEGFTSALMGFRKRHTALLALACLALTIAGIAGLTRFTFEGDVSALNHLSPGTQEDMDRFLATWGKASPSIFMVEAPGLDQALEKNDALFQRLKHMEKDGIISSFASLTGIFPSRTEREKRLAAVRQVFSPQRTALLKKELEQACLANGFAGDAFSPFIRELEEIENPPASFKLEDFTHTIIYPLIKSKLIIKPEKVMVMTTAQISDKSQIPAISARIKKEIPGTLFIDKPYLVRKITGLVGAEFKQFFIWAGLSMVVILILFQRQIKLAAVTIIPVSLSAVITAGILGLADIPVNLISIVFIIFVFGVGVDFSIFLVHHETNPAPDKRQITPGAVLICAMTTIGAFTCLCFARHKALFSIGAAGLTGMTVSLFLALVIIPFLCEHWVCPPSKEDI